MEWKLWQVTPKVRTLVRAWGVGNQDFGADAAWAMRRQTMARSWEAGSERRKDAKI